MLLSYDPHTNTYRLFPALPKEWDGKEVSFCGLRLPGGHRVSAKRAADGTVTRHEDSATRRVVRFIFDGHVTPIVTYAILAEYREVLSRPKFHFRQDVADTIISHFSKYGRLVEPTPYAKPLSDEKDRAFLEAALSLFDEGAMLVTGNAKHFPPAPFVVTPAAFIALLKNA